MSKIFSAIWQRGSRWLLLLGAVLLLAGQAHAANTVTVVTVDGGASTAVTAGSTIAVNVTNVTSGGTDWGSTRWYIGTSPPGTWTCNVAPTPTIASNGTNTVSLGALAVPATPGTYNLYIQTSSSASACTNNLSAVFTLANSVVVMGPPDVSTGAASALTTASASLNGTVSSNGAATAVTFQYGLTTGYGSSVTASASPLGAGAVDTAVTAAVSGLACGTLYHYRVVGVNSYGTSNGADQSFTTAACPVVTSINTASTNPTLVNTAVSWSVVFSTGVTGVDAGDFALVLGGGATGASITSVSGSGTSWTVTANTGSAYGSVGLNLVDNDSVVNAQSSPLGGSGAANGNFTGQVYTVAPPAPTLSKVASTAAAVVGDVVTFTITATNPHASSLTSLTISDVLPAGMGYATSAVTMGSVAVSGQTVTWTIPTLIAGANAQLTLAVTLTAQGALTNTVSAPNATSASASVLVLASAVTHFHLDETVGAWAGVAGEVIDSGGNATHGRRFRNAAWPATTTNTVNPTPTIASQYPAVVGGFCNAARFDGNAVVEVPHSATFDYTNRVSASAWIYPTSYPPAGGLYSILSNDQNYEFHLNSAGRLNWWWGGAPRELTSAAQIPLNQWTHIAITMDASATGGRERIYINGVADANTNNWQGTLAGNPCNFYIGGDVTTGSCALIQGRNFRGTIDEIKLYGYELSAAEVNADMTLGRNCSGTFDHIRIEHDGAGSVCTPEPVTVKACLNPSCTTLYTGNVTVNMSPTGWVGGNTLVLTNGVGTISLSNAVSGNVTVGTSSVSPTAANPTRCFNGGTETCVLNFANASCNFDAVQPGANPQTRLFTKLAGANFDVDVLAVSGSTVNTGYTGSVQADLVDASASSCPTGAGLTAAQTLTFAAGDAGRKSNVVFNYATPMPNVRVRMRVGAGTPACSTDNFAIRPSSVTLLTSPAMATAPSATASPTIKAGASFTLNASATAGYGGTVTLDVGKLTAQTTTQDTSVASGGVVGTLAPGTLVVNATASNNASYSEVGYVYLAAGAFRDDTFTAVDQPAGCATTSTCDCVTDTTSNNNLSASLVGVTGRYGCHIGSTAASLGRFIPDHFSVTAGTPVAACTAHPAASGSYTPADFTYFSQPQGFSTPFTLTAWNALATPTATANYAGVFARISAAGWAWTNTSSATGLRFGTQTALPAGAVLAVAAPGGTPVVPAGTWANGAVALTSVRHQISRPTALTNPTAVVVTAMPRDADGVTLPAAQALGAANLLRYGRVQMQNRYGSEKLPLAIPVQAQFWSGSSFVTNVDDSCTVVSVPVERTLAAAESPDGVANLYFYPLVANKNQLAQADTAATMASPLVGGVSAMQFAKPGKAGWLDAVLDVPDYLKGHWGNCMGQTGTAGLLDDLPCARATFGVFKSPLIYRRENY